MLNAEELERLVAELRERGVDADFEDFTHGHDIAASEEWVEKVLNLYAEDASDGNGYSRIR